MDLSEFKTLEELAAAIKTLDMATAIDWKDHSPDSTIVGWSSFSIKDIRFQITINKLVFVQYVLEGTSNSVTTTFTVPFAKATDESNVEVPRVRDNGGAWVAGLSVLGNGSTTVTLFSSPNGGGWTGSGSKGAQGQFTYRML